jgi:uncharacterized protein YcbK (DUF882 family)
MADPRDEELAALRAERDRAVQARDALIREVLPLTRPVATPSNRGRTVAGLFVCALFAALIVFVWLQHQRAMRRIAAEGQLGRAPIAARVAREPQRPPPLSRSRVQVIAVPEVQLLGRVALSPDGAQVALTGDGGFAALYDLQTDRVVHRLRGHRGPVRAAAFTRDGGVVTGGADGSVRLWHRATGRELRALRASGAPVRSLAVSRALVAVAGEEGALRLYPLAGGSPRVLEGHRDWVRAVAFASDGRLASGGHDRLIRVWDVGGALLQTLRGHSMWVSALAFDPEGRRLASAGLDGRLLIWDVAAGTVLRRMRGHARHVESLAFSPRGDAVVSASLDRTAIVWDASLGRERVALLGHRYMVSTAVFDPAGRFVLTASSDGTLRLWPQPLLLPAVSAPLGQPAEDEVTLRNNTTGERLRLALLDERGDVRPAAAARLGGFLRSGPDDRASDVDPQLIHLLDAVAARFGRGRELIVISGFRSAQYNELRTRQSREVAKESQHLEGKAIDLRVEGVTIMALRDFLKKQRRGGVGFYPDSNFVHMDTGRVRSWSGE